MGSMSKWHITWWLVAERDWKHMVIVLQTQWAALSHHDTKDRCSRRSIPLTLQSPEQTSYVTILLVTFLAAGIKYLTRKATWGRKGLFGWTVWGYNVSGHRRHGDRSLKQAGHTVSARRKREGEEQLQVDHLFFVYSPIPQHAHQWWLPSQVCPITSVITIYSPYHRHMHRFVPKGNSRFSQGDNQCGLSHQYLYPNWTKSW